MKDIVGFYTSSRKTGFSNQLIDQVLEGAKSAGASIITYDLNDDVKGCQGCYFCRKNEGCATKDNLHLAYEQIKEAKGIVVGFPIYFGNISGQGKIWLDRMFPLMGPDFSPRYDGKKCVTIYAQGNPDKNICKTAIDTNNNFIKRFGWEITDSILNYGNNQPGYKIPDELMKRAFEAGKQLVK